MLDALLRSTKQDGKGALYLDQAEVRSKLNPHPGPFHEGRIFFALQAGLHLLSPNLQKSLTAMFPSTTWS